MSSTSLPSNLQNLKIVATTELRMVNRAMGATIRKDASVAAFREHLNYSPNFADNLYTVWKDECSKFFMQSVVDAIIGRTQRDIETTFYGAFQLLNEYYAELVKFQLLPWEAISAASKTQGLRKFGVYTGSLVSSLVAVMGNSLAKSNYKTVLMSQPTRLTQEKKNVVIHGLLAVHLDNQRRYERAATMLAIARRTADKQGTAIDIHDTGESVEAYGWNYLKSISNRFDSDEIQDVLETWIEQFARESIVSGGGIEISPGVSKTLEKLKRETARLHIENSTKILIAAQNRRRWLDEQARQSDASLKQQADEAEQDARKRLTRKQAVIARRMQSILAKLSKDEEFSPSEIQRLINLEKSITTAEAPQRTEAGMRLKSLLDAVNKETPRPVPTKGDTEKTVSHPVPNTATSTQEERFIPLDSNLRIATILEATNAHNTIVDRIQAMRAQEASGGLPYAETLEQAVQIARDYHIARNLDIVDGEVHIYVVNELLNALYNLKQRFNLPEIDIIGTREAVDRQLSIMNADNQELGGHPFESEEERNRFIANRYEMEVDRAVQTALMSIRNINFSTIGQVIGFNINPRYYDSMEAVVHQELTENAAIRNKWHTPKGDYHNGVQHIIRHETGHIIHDLLGIIATTKDANGNTITITTDPEIQRLYNFLKRTPEIGRNRVSKYAMTNINEFIAECWAEYASNPAGARSDAQLVAQRLIMYMRAKFGNS